MDKLTKIGVSALCGSLAAVSAANAGAMSVSGSASMTWISLDEETTGNPLGIATGLTFSGAGELDNGSTFTVSIAHTHKNVYSVSNVSVTTPSLGTFQYDEGGGTGLDRIDDMMPTAWEESTGTGIASGLRTVAGAGGSTDIEWSVGSGMLPDGMNVYLSWAPHPDGTKNSKKAAGGDSGGAEVNNGDGFDVVMTHSGLADGLNLFAGYSKIDQIAAYGDREQHAMGLTYAIGGVTIGYQHSVDRSPGVGGATTDAYVNDAWGVSFAVNDDFTISYGTHESKKTKAIGTEVGNGDITTETKSFQASYTMGGASIVLAESEVDNKLYATTAASQREGRTIALTLAF